MAVKARGRNAYLFPQIASVINHLKKGMCELILFLEGF